MSSNEIVRVPANDVTRGTLDEKIRYAQAIVGATTVNGVYKNPANVLVAIEYGQALGIPTMQAISSINIIKGKPTLSGDLMAALVRQAGHKLRIKKTGKGAQTSVTATLIRADDPDAPFTVTWDINRAKQAGLVKPDSGWTKYPEQMMRARAISEVCRDGATDALMGISYVAQDFVDYTDDEIAEGRVEVQPEPETTTVVKPTEQQQVKETPREDREQILAYASEVCDWDDAYLAKLAGWFPSHFDLPVTEQEVDSPAEFVEETWQQFVVWLDRRPEMIKRDEQNAAKLQTAYGQETLDIEDAEVEE